MSMLEWSESDFLACLEVEPVVEENQISHTFEVRRGGVILRLSVWQYESVIHISLAVEPGTQPLIELAAFFRERAAGCKVGGQEFLEPRDCILAASRFSYLEMGDVFDRRRYPHSHRIKIQVLPQIQVEIMRA